MSVAQTMRAVVVERFGGPDVLRLREVPRPVPGPGQALVRVEATGVCHHDLLDRAGKLPRVEPDRILGHEVAGTVVELGATEAAAPDAGAMPEGLFRQIVPGQRVVVYHRMFCGRCRHCLAGRHDLCRRSSILGSEVDGGYAEYVCVPTRNLLPLPDELDWPSGALVVCPIGTVVRAVLGVAGIGPGDTVVVTGASGGLGLHQVQLCHYLGARVVAVSRSPAKVEAVQAAGADEVVVVPDGRFSGEVWRLTGKQGADVVLDNVVTGILSESLRALGQNGLVVITGNVGVEPVSLDPALIIVRRQRLAGSGNATFDDVRRAMHLLSIGAIRAQIAAVMPFERAAEAHERLESRSTCGRIVLAGW